MNKGPIHRYWDASAFFKGEPGRAEDCRLLLNEAKAGRHVVVTSAITFAEVTRTSGAPVLAEHRGDIQAFFENSYIRPVNVDRFTAFQVRDLIWEHPQLRPVDAIHIASAIRANCPLLYTFDQKLLALDRQIDNLAIEEPKIIGQLALSPTP